MINELNSVDKYKPLLQQELTTNSQENTKNSFADTMKDFVGEVDLQQKQSKELTEAFVRGEQVELHDVILAGEQAKTSFQLLMELRAKGLDLYREVLRMQV